MKLHKMEIVPETMKTVEEIRERIEELLAKEKSYTSELNPDSYEIKRDKLIKNVGKIEALRWVLDENS